MRKVSYKEKEISYGAAKLSRQGKTLTVHLQYNGAYGMGEKFDSLNQKGHHVVNRVEEKFCFQGDKTYNPSTGRIPALGCMSIPVRQRNLTLRRMKSA